MSSTVDQAEAVRSKWPPEFGRKKKNMCGSVVAYETMSVAHDEKYARAAVLYVDQNGAVSVYGNQLLCESIRRSSVLPNFVAMVNDRQHLEQVSNLCDLHVRSKYVPYVLTVL